MEQKSQSNPLTGMHQQKLYSLIITGVALIAIILPWITLNVRGYTGGSANGFRSWGFLSIIGVAGVAIACFVGDKTKEFDETFKKVAIGSFAGIAAGALIFFLANISSKGNFLKAGLGLWLCLISGVAGVILTLGLIKLPNYQTTSSNNSGSTNTSNSTGTNTSNSTVTNTSINSNKTSIIILVLGIASFLISQTMDSEVLNRQDDVVENTTKKIFQYIGIGLIVVGGLLFANGMTKKK